MRVVTLYALAADDGVTEVGSLEAQAVEFRPERDNLLWSRASPADPPSCYRPDLSDRRSVGVRCP